MAARVKVKYKHKNSTTSWGGTVKGQSESAILEVLRKRHPGEEIVILEIKWQ